MARPKAVVIIPDDPVDDENTASHPYTSKSISELDKEVSGGVGQFDRPRGWVVCLGGFLVQAWVFGCILNFTLFFGEFQNEFQADEKVIGWIGSLQWCMFLTGPLASLVVIRVGSMLAIIIGAVLTSVGFLSSAYSTDIYQLYFTYGFMIGCGMGLPFLASYSVLSDYFRKHLRLATAIITIGGGVGIFAFAALFEFLIEKYEWRGCLLINAGIALHLVPLAMLMRSHRRDPSERVPGIREMLGVHVFRIPKFRWILLHMLLWNIGLNVLFIHLVRVVADASGITAKEAAVVVLVQGVANTIGRCLAIPFLYQRFVDILKVYAVCAVLMGIFQIMMVSCSSLLGFSVVVSGVTLSFGLMLCYIVPVFVELVGVENVTAALGYSNLCQGIGGIIGPPLIDVVVHGVKIFMVGGIFTTFGGLAAAVAVFLHFRRPKSNSGKAASSQNGLRGEYALAGGNGVSA